MSNYFEQIHFELVYVQGAGKENEDAYVAGKPNRVFSVIDGATGLTGLSGKLAAGIVKEALENLRAHESLIHGVTAASERLDAEASSLKGVPYTDDIPKEERSTCGLAAVKLNGESLEYIHAGDCMIFVRYKNNEIRSVTHDLLSRLDAAAIQLFAQKMKEKTAADPNALEEPERDKLLREIRRDIMPLLVENRKKLNTPDGYGIIDGSRESLKYLELGSVPLHYADSILLLTDGLQLPDQKGFGWKAWHDTAAYAFAHGLERLKDEVIRLEASDPACCLYPRLKFADDKTGILIRL